MGVLRSLMQTITTSLRLSPAAQKKGKAAAALAGLSFGRWAGVVIEREAVRELARAARAERDCADRVSGAEKTMAP